MTKPTPSQIAKIFGCTEQQVRKQFASNAKQLSSMASKAQRTSRKVNGFTAEQLCRMADNAAANA